MNSKIRIFLWQNAAIDNSSGKEIDSFVEREKYVFLLIPEIKQDKTA